MAENEKKVIHAAVIKPRTLIFSDDLDRLPADTYRIQETWGSVEALRRSIKVLESIGIQVTVDMEGFSYESSKEDSENPQAVGV